MNNRQKTKNTVYSILTVLGFLVLSFFSIESNAQGKNFTYFKLIIVNEKDEILLVNFQDTWEPAGRKYDSPTTVKKVLEEMGAEMGVTFENPKLRGLVANFYDKSEYPVMFNYVIAKYKSGELQIPPGCKGIDWYPIDKGIKIIPFESLRLIMTKMFEEGNRDQLWAGSVRITTHSGSSKSAKIIEEFYPY